jgi:hypothetical protein
VKWTGSRSPLPWTRATTRSPGPTPRTLAWTYAKDANTSASADAAWLDHVTFLTNPPLLTLQPASQRGTAGAALALTAAASGAPPLAYQWSKDGTNLSGATSSSYAIARATRRDSGVYQVVASNPGGGTPSSNATLAVHTPQKIGLPLRLSGGVVTLISADADGGPLLSSDLSGFQVLATTNFLSWVTVLNSLAVSNGVLLFTDPDSTNYPRRFYRIIEP